MISGSGKSRLMRGLVKVLSPLSEVKVDWALVVLKKDTNRSKKKTMQNCFLPLSVEKVLINIDDKHLRIETTSFRLNVLLN